jgi:hypothetical protein
MGRRGFSGPPTSPPDPDPINTHDHEWRPTEDSPIMEDGAAIFREECRWAEVTSATHSKKHDETFYGYGAECEETRSYRFEYSRLILADDVEVELPEITEWDEVPDPVERIVIEIEEMYHAGEAEIHIDPDQQDGEAIISHGVWELHYEP